MSRTHLQDTMYGEVKKTAPIEDVIMLQADQKYVTCHYPGGELLLSDTLDSLEAEFPDQFVRVHRSRLVAKRLIQPCKVTHNGLVMRIDGLSEPVPVARRRRAMVSAMADSLKAERASWNGSAIE